MGHANHIYRAEFWSPPPLLKAQACAKYEGDTPASVFSRERYTWHSGPSRPGRWEVLYGTAYAQRVVWDHQHPRDCGGARFLTMLHWPTGIGALLHFLARALGLAMQLQRILVLSREGSEAKPGVPGMPWYDASFCPGGLSWECWFQPLTNCSELPGSDTLIVQPEQLGRFRAGNFTRHYVPDVFQELLLECSQVKPSLRFYWWTAQAVAYIVRFNGATRRRLDRLRGSLLRIRRPGSQAPTGSLRDLPLGTIAMHVRRGDKALEMLLMPYRRYLEQAERLACGSQRVRVLDEVLAETNRTFAYPRDHFAGMVLFLSTEDPQVIREAGELATARLGKKPWQVIFTRENRTNVSVIRMLLQKGSGSATLESLLNLELALEADAWVCTLFSNWCMLIDQLRMTVGGKAGAPYIDMASRGNRCPAFDRHCYTIWR